jgi:two-component system, OmpR family, sensor histidine kinase KdpD
MREQRTAALYELVQQAGLAPDLDNALGAAIDVTESLFGVRAALLLQHPDDTLGEATHLASSFPLDEKEYGVAAWAFAHRIPAGKFTDNLADSKAMHLPLRARTAVLGILSILPPPGTTLDLAERELLEAFAMLIGTILERDRLHQDLKQAEIIKVSERLQRALLQSFSHELKTPLSAVQAGIEAFRREAGGPRSQAAWSESQKALRRLRRVINNLLDMTRIESGVIHPNLDWCDVAELIQAAADLAADGVGETPVAIELDANVPLIRVDQPLLEQCLCNLLLNASASSAPGAKVVIRARVADGQLFLSVLDEGSGISEADLPRIFGAFQRGAAATPGGTGLGLAIVEGFVLAHGGSVSAANRPSGGAEFTMKIPVETLRPEVLERLA